jgi:predicted CoA-substrate-specific enzyme activase
MNEADEIVEKLYLRTLGQPIKVIQEGLKLLTNLGEWEVLGVGVTGSGRQLAGSLLRADVIKNEITAHSVAACHEVPDVQTVLEIGGQDSKIIILRNQVVADFAMNTVCAAGTGSFLDQQAARLNINIEDFGKIALTSTNPVRIAGRCTVFAESDMIHKQQLGVSLPDILAGLCEAMVRNYLNNVAKGKEILPPVVFQGGVAANKAIKVAFEQALGLETSVPRHFDVMGALGVSILAREQVTKKGKTTFSGFEIIDNKITTQTFECHDCPNHCEIVRISDQESLIACWGSRCGKFEKVANIAI